LVIFGKASFGVTFNIKQMAFYIGNKSDCKAYDIKVSNQLGFGGSITTSWADVRRHPAKSLFSVIAHASITPDEGSGLKLVEQLDDTWNETLEDL
jgi:hypothetical protein